MADFKVVHRKELEEGQRRLRDRPFDIWSMVLQGPLTVSDKAPVGAESVFTIIQFKLDMKGRPVFLDKGSRKAVADWTERYKDAPNEAFELPELT